MVSILFRARKVKSKLACWLSGRKFFMPHEVMLQSLTWHV